MEKIKEWAKQIYPGAEEYAFPGITFKQMDVIVRGLELGVDVRQYAKPEYDYMQMNALLRGLVSGVDITLYSNPKLNSNKMLLILDDILCGYDVTNYNNPDNSFLYMSTVSYCLNHKLKIIPYLNMGFDAIQLREICKGLEDKVNVKRYAKPEYSAGVMRKMRRELLSKKRIDMR